jgi:hypothetical protein
MDFPIGYFIWPEDLLFEASIVEGRMSAYRITFFFYGVLFFAVKSSTQKIQSQKIPEIMH